MLKGLKGKNGKVAVIPQTCFHCKAPIGVAITKKQLKALKQAFNLPTPEGMMRFERVTVGLQTRPS
jgi:hypothetical protein